MNKIILDKNQLTEFILKSKYQVNKDLKLTSRCIDGRYDKQSRIQNLEFRIPEMQLPALAIPGADAGELALIFATINNYGLEMDEKKVWKTLVEVVGGEKNLQFHTDSHADKNIVLGGCGHMKQINIDSKAYGITSEQFSIINYQFSQAKKLGVVETDLHGDHQEAAVVMVRGNFGIYPQLEVETTTGKRNMQIFIYHQTLVDERHKILAKKLIENRAITAPFEFDEKYLYEALSETGENHLMETVKRLAVGLPIYQVTFKNNGEFKIEEMGKVE
ncbi:hypothetical protein AUK04_03750 [Candidatus Roizmanbacteria bacterium CG2_30_33_16]|uniref:Uncharacterized protein n=5 Tax=Candidatus Roizmaniibacteriota TaxID=1752723 RepID=A0A2M7E532_9BACT|nr:hypothetical protein [Candidatus Roizmanbacteria bacterium]OIP83139.1 MAG: hypothetical protein AUK04_03750 [Candidatus Roizmanbacteria bacterium CG2_30_33_16]PIP64741.1 MAG: hypothetical protein COW96_00870 [Candidatus Roizmanbacteria bacterium CG22_combo_CG10-13_8_21_14_all_33_16]PIV62823.1 MAG: hypothetical protein COS12_00965 [Candidatus Roizmanbacteria bacterium CG01_land_8_20_14_3_00_33_9]PIX71051.1 MAG: hypothetical protein COZ39_04015 [Candidatus Roizmanbacteria bacterium CG_4_10_14_